MDAFLRCMQTCSVERIRTTDVFEYIFCLKSCFLNEDFFREVKGGSTTCVVQCDTWWCCGARWRVTSSAANRLIGEVVQSRRRPLLGPTSAFTFKTLLRHYANQPARPLCLLRRRLNFTSTYRGVNACLA